MPTGGTPTRFGRGLECENGSSPCAASSQSGFWNAESFLKDSTFCVVLVLLGDSLKNSTRSSSVSHLLMCQLATCPSVKLDLFYFCNCPAAQMSTTTQVCVADSFVNGCHELQTQFQVDQKCNAVVHFILIIGTIVIAIGLLSSRSSWLYKAAASEIPILRSFCFS